MVASPCIISTVSNSSPAATAPVTVDVPVDVPDPVAFGTRPDISARSVLVTIFGDSVVPAGGEIWLGDLIEVCRLFGFNDRLIRTSMFRLGAEGWFEVERVGRRSRYRLTPWANGEFATAEGRIYGGGPAPWDGQWTLVFVATDPTTGLSAAEPIRRALAGTGCAPISAGVLALPRTGPDEVAHLLARNGVTRSVPVAQARFADLAALAGAGWPANAFELGPVAERYRAVISRYQSIVDDAAVDDADWTGLDDQASFALRTMVIHELRRARLADPDLPAEVLPPDWPAPAARRLAATLYRGVSDGAERWLAATTGLHVDRARTASRFPPSVADEGRQ